MIRYLKSKDYDVYSTNMYLYAEGTLPICLCAHMDTVFSTPPTNFYYDKEQDVLWSPQGLGADDRAGIYAIISLLERGFRPSIILTDEEEKGGIGAEALVHKHPICPFPRCKALIQIDRHGSRDSVYYECDNKDFEKLINSYGFETNWGSFTDISIFAPVWKIAAVNLSTGYYDEHHNIETLHMKELELTIRKIAKMLIDVDKWDRYEYVPLKVESFKSLFEVYQPPTDWNTIPSINKTCICCGVPLSKDNCYRCNATKNPEDDFYCCKQCYEELICS